MSPTLRISAALLITVLLVSLAGVGCGGAVSLPSAGAKLLSSRSCSRPSVSVLGSPKPWGDSDRFEFILVCGQLLWRVQVKSAWVGPRYAVKASGAKGITYTPDEIDFLVAYIIAEDLWYVVPLASLGSRIGLTICPLAPHSTLAQYREAWSQFSVSSTAF